MNEYPRSEALEAACSHLNDAEKIGVLSTGLRALEKEITEYKEALIQSAHAFDQTVPLLAGSKFDYPNMSCRQGQRISHEVLNRLSPGWDTSNEPEDED